MHNLRPIVAERGVNADPTEDQYFKGALMLNTLRSVVNDDAKWWALLRGFYQRFKYQNILTEDVIAYFNLHTGMNLTPSSISTCGARPSRDWSCCLVRRRER